MRISVKTFNTIFFYFAYITFLSFSTFGHIPELKIYLKPLTNLGLALLILMFILNIQKYKKSEVLIFVGMLIFSFILIFTSNYYGIFKLTLLIATSKNIDFRKCIKFDLITRILFVGIMFILFMKGIAPDVISYFEGSLRHSMGFENPNHVGMMAFILISEITILCKAKLNKTNLFSIILIIVLADLVAGSRTSTLMSLMILGFVIIYNLYPKFYEYKFIEFMAKYCACICAGFTFFGLLLYRSGNSIALALDKLLSGRFYNLNYYYSRYGISLFGVDTSLANRTNDNLYGYWVICLGLVASLIFAFLYVKTIKDLYQSNKPLTIVLVCFMIYGLSERLWFNVDYNILMLSFRSLIYRDLINTC